MSIRPVSEYPMLPRPGSATLAGMMQHQGYLIASLTRLFGEYGFAINRLIKRTRFDTLANRPTAEEADRFFFATDTKELYYDDGSSWTLIASENLVVQSDIGTAAAEDTGKTIGDIPQYEDNGSGNPVLDHPNMPLVGGDAVVESGSNSNGEFVRYADGTQICWGTVSPSIGSTQWGSSGVYRSDTSGNNDADWTYPKSFVSDPKVFADAKRFNTIGFTINISTTVAEIGIMEDNQSVTRSCSVMAIGRWK